MTSGPREASADDGRAGASPDYRQSHLERGPTYDSTLGASAFDAYMARWEAHWLVRFARELYPEGIPRYLDFACGTGRITQVLAPLARESVGVDVSGSMLDVARAKCPGTRFVEADLTHERLDEGPFDVVTAFRFLGNAQDPLRGEALRAIAGLLRPGGHLIVNNHRNPMSVAALLHRMTGGSDGMDLTYFKLRRLLHGNGFELSRVRAIGTWMIRSSMQARANPDGAGAAGERLFGASVFAPLAPDMILVVRKR